MIRLHVVQAEYGDCFILESKSGEHSVNVLIDGGPYQTYDKHLKPALRKLLSHGKLNLMILSHIDNDHIIGLLDLLEDIKSQREKGTKELANIEKMWHNSFLDLLQFQQEPLKLLEQHYLSIPNGVKRKEITNSLVMKGFQQGTDLTKLAKLLKIHTNPDFDELIVVTDKIKSINFNDITLHLLGPTRKNVDRLQKEWKKWSKEKNAESLAGLTQILDKSIPNLSSIAFLATSKNKKILFTGDGLGQDIVDVLTKNNMLDKDGKFHVDVLKIPHHGSDRNTSSEFFNVVHADYYIISANGRDDNPSLDTLRWLIESEKTNQELKKIVLTNNTPNVKKILQEYDQNKYYYQTIIMEKKSHFITIDLK